MLPGIYVLTKIFKVNPSFVIDIEKLCRESEKAGKVASSWGRI